MIRPLCATVALLAATQVAAVDPTTQTTQTYPTTAPAATLPPVDPSCPQLKMDGLNDVFLPPLLDEENTHVVFGSGSEDMQVRLLVPKQYATLKVSFEGATNQAAAVNVNLAAPFANMWHFDSTSDPCNVIATSKIPWNQFRGGLGGINERRYANAVWYGTNINIETTFDFDLKPNTLLAEGDNNPHHIQRHTRLVRNIIPFDMHFDLDLTLWAQTNVRSPYLRKASALLETSVLEVTPDQATLARGQLVFVTTIPSPLILSEASIAVNDPLLAHGLTVEEIISQRDCNDVNVEAFCTQHWLVNVEPKKCDLNGQYTATMFGTCNPQSNNCIEPTPNTMDIVFGVTSDDYCGVSQQVDLRGSLSIKPTECNKYMKGSVVTSSPQGAKIASVKILKLETTPTLEGQNFLTIFDSSKNVNILSFSTSQPRPNQVDWQFEWRGKQLRCDVVAQVDAMVIVEFEATQPLLLSTASIDGRSGAMTLFADETIQTSERVHITADPNAPKQAPPQQQTNAPRASTQQGSAASATATSVVGTAVGIFAALFALM